jgi:ribose 5-phosphate isomerase B
MQIYIGSDYRGFNKKQVLIDYLKELGIKVDDLGAHEYKEGDDFNDPAIAVAKAILKNPDSFGILLCGSAHGVTMQANRFKGIRAAHCDTPESAVLARTHENSNVLCLSAQFKTDEEVKAITRTFLDTEFENLERRIRRIKRLDDERELLC